MAEHEECLGTLANLKARLGVLDTDKDTQLEHALLAATRMIESCVGRKLSYNSAIAEYVDSDGSPELLVSRPPIASVASVAYRGEAVDTDEWAATGPDLEAGVIRSENVWVRTSGMRGEGAAHTVLHDYNRHSYLVTYAGGYVTHGQAAAGGSYEGETVTLPADIEEQCYRAAMFLAGRYGGKTPPAIGWSGLPVEIENALAPHRMIAQA